MGAKVSKTSYNSEEPNRTPEAVQFLLTRQLIGTQSSSDTRL
jgi:hypothetical protein